jgi:shikimate dehydrogenase
MYAAAFSAAGLDATYEAWDTPEETLEGRVHSLRGSDYLGANVTIPHKRNVVPLLDATAGAATTIGAVNTIVYADGKLTGHNTDVAGFARALREDGGFDPKKKRAMLLGSGGAARAVALALIEGGAEVVFLMGRTPRNLDKMAVEMKPLTPTGTTITWAYWGDGSYLEMMRGADLVVNCTPIGTAGGADAAKSPVEASLMQPHTLFFDLVYNPAETPFLAAAKSRGAKTVPGLGMLVYQAAESFKLWTGQEADTAKMFEAARGALTTV